jgi:hypothetical protein
VAALWCNTEVVLQTLDQATLAQNTGHSVLLEFINKWLDEIDSFYGMHDRKVCALGLCTLLQMGSKRPHDIAQMSTRLLPSICTVLESLEKSYANQAKEDEEDDEDDSDDDYDESGDADLEGMNITLYHRLKTNVTFSYLICSLPYKSLLRRGRRRREESRQEQDEWHRREREVEKERDHR